MTSDRIKEIQKNTAYPNSVSVMIALNQVWNECTQENNQNTKPLIEKISSLEASLLDVTRKSCARVDELKDEIAKLKASKSEANEAVESQEDILRELISLIQTSSSVGIIMQKFTITRNNK